MSAVRIVRQVVRAVFRAGTRRARQTGRALDVRMWAATLMGDKQREQRIRAAKKMARTIKHELRRQGYSYQPRKTRRKGRAPRVQIVNFRNPILTHDDELWLPIDLSKLPHGVTSQDLKQDDVLMGINDRCQLGRREDRERAAIRYDYLPGKELCYVIPIRGSSFPAVFPVNDFDWQTAVDFVTGKKPREIPPLAVPLGFSAAKEHMFADLARCKHVLIAGMTGSGKTTLLHAMLTAIINRCRVGYVEFWLADPKRTELSLYRGLRSIAERKGFVRRVEVETQGMLDMLLELSNEMDRRQKEQESRGAVNSDHYFEITGDWQPYIIAVVEELAGLMMSKAKVDKGYTVRSRSEELIQRIASQGRSSHIILLLITQHPSSDVVTGLIKGNMPVKVAFNTADHYKSQTIIESSDAVGLPTGRMMARTEEGFLVELQAPLITAQQIKLIVDRVEKYGPDGGLGESDHIAKMVGEMKLLICAARDHTDGKFTEKAIMGAPGIKGTISIPRYRELASLLIEKDVVYLGKPKGGGARGKYVHSAFLANPDMLDTLFGVDRSTPETLRDTSGLSKNQANPESGDTFRSGDLKHPNEIPEVHITNRNPEVYGSDSPTPHLRIIRPEEIETVTDDDVSEVAKITAQIQELNRTLQQLTGTGGRK